MRITKLIVDEKNRNYVVGLEGGQEFTGIRAMNEIRIEKREVIENKKKVEKLDAVLDIWSIRFLKKPQPRRK